MTTATARATMEDLLRVEGKAELIGGRIVHLMPGSRRHNRVAARIFRSLDDHAERTKRGEAYTDNMTFGVDEMSTDRQSFAPDAAYYGISLGSDDDEPGVVYDAPTFAVEVLSDGDYGLTGELAMAEKRVEYFEAGTKVLWDVDPEAKVIHSYRPDAPDTPATFAAGQIANAEPAVPGWTMAVDDVFKK